jgi:hypothetical protein
MRTGIHIHADIHLGLYVVPRDTYTLLAAQSLLLSAVVAIFLAMSIIVSVAMHACRTWSLRFWPFVVGAVVLGRRGGLVYASELAVTSFSCHVIVHVFVWPVVFVLWSYDGMSFLFFLMLCSLT